LFFFFLLSPGFTDGSRNSAARVELTGSPFSFFSPFSAQRVHRFAALPFSPFSFSSLFFPERRQRRGLGACDLGITEICPFFSLSSPFFFSFFFLLSFSGDTG